MTLDFVLAVGGIALVGVAIFTAWSVVQAARVEGRARADLAHATAAGMLPPSLHPKVDLDRCIGSGSCVESCPERDVLGVISGKAHVVNPTACIGHGECLRACPVEAITLVLGHERRGVDIPLVQADFQTNVPGLYVVGELGGMGLIVNAMTQALQCLDAIRADPPPRTEGVHQLVIVGAGPAGMAASLSAMEGGLDFVCVDQESLGGTVLQYPRHKIVMTRPIDLPLYGRLHVTEVSKEALLDAWRDIVARTGLQVREGTRVEGVTRGEDGVFEVRTPSGTLRAHRVVLAMGRRGTPRKLGVPGEDLPKVTYRLLEPERYAGARVLVVGGGDSAVEAAIALGEAGAAVHLSYRKGAFSRIKPKNQRRLDAAVEAGRVSLLLNTHVAEIHPDRVVFEEEEVADLPNDYVLIFAGGVLPTAFLEAAGVAVRTFRGEAFAPANA